MSSRVVVSDEVKALFSASESGRTDILKTALDHLSKKRQIIVNEDHRPPLEELSMVQNGSTPLHLASSGGHVDASRLLLQAGADPTCIARDGPFKRSNPYEIGTESVKSVFSQEIFRRVALGDAKKVAALLDCGVDPNVIDGSPTENSLLHWASSFSNPHIISILLDRGANPNSLNNDGHTPLHQACIGDIEENIFILLKNGADPKIRCSGGQYQGKSAYDIAASQGIDIDHILNDFQNISNHQELQEEEEGGETEEDLDTDLALKGSNLPESSSEDEIEENLPLIWPPPHYLYLKKNNICALLDGYISISSIENDFNSLEITFPFIQAALQYHNISKVYKGKSFPLDREQNVAIKLSINQSLYNRKGPQYFSLQINEQSITVQGSDQLGLLYGAQTLSQIIRLYGKGLESVSNNEKIPMDKFLVLPCLTLEDKPQILRRATLLDLREQHCPNLKNIEIFIGRAVSWRFNAMVLLLDTMTYEIISSTYFGSNDATWKWNDLIRTREVLTLSCVEPVAGWSIRSEDFINTNNSFIEYALAFSNQIGSTEIFLDFSNVGCIEGSQFLATKSINITNLVNRIQMKMVENKSTEVLVLSGLSINELVEIEGGMEDFDSVSVMFSITAGDETELKNLRSLNLKGVGYFASKRTQETDVSSLAPADLSLSLFVLSTIQAANLSSNAGMPQSVISIPTVLNPTHLSPKLLQLLEEFSSSGLIWSPLKCGSILYSEELGELLSAHLTQWGFSLGEREFRESIIQFLFPQVMQNKPFGPTPQDAWALLRGGNLNKNLEESIISLSTESLEGFKSLRKHLSALDGINDEQALFCEMRGTANLLKMSCRTLLIFGHHLHNSNVSAETDLNKISLKDAVKCVPLPKRMDLANRFLREYENIRKRLEPPLQERARNQSSLNNETLKFCYNSLLAVVELLNSGSDISKRIDYSAEICKEVMYGKSD